MNEVQCGATLFWQEPIDAHQVTGSEKISGRLASGYGFIVSNIHWIDLHNGLQITAGVNASPLAYEWDLRYSSYLNIPGLKDAIQRDMVERRGIYHMGLGYARRTLVCHSLEVRAVAELGCAWAKKEVGEYHYTISANDTVVEVLYREFAVNESGSVVPLARLDIQIGYRLSDRSMLTGGVSWQIDWQKDLISGKYVLYPSSPFEGSGTYHVGLSNLGLGIAYVHAIGFRN